MSRFINNIPSCVARSRDVRQQQPRLTTLTPQYSGSIYEHFQRHPPYGYISPPQERIQPRQPPGHVPRRLLGNIQEEFPHGPQALAISNSKCDWTKDFSVHSD